MANPQRPTSPFMLGQYYKFQITSLMSILHRIAGVILSVGSFALAWWLMAMAAGGDAALRAQACFGSIIGKLALFVFSLALVYHMLNGVRHLFWDAGFGFELPDMQRSGYAVGILTVVLTAAIWLFALGVL